MEAKTSAAEGLSRTRRSARRRRRALAPRQPFGCGNKTLPCGRRRSLTVAPPFPLCGGTQPASRPEGGSRRRRDVAAGPLTPGPLAPGEGALSLAAHERRVSRWRQPESNPRSAVPMRRGRGRRLGRADHGQRLLLRRLPGGGRAARRVGRFFGGGQFRRRRGIHGLSPRSARLHARRGPPPGDAVERGLEDAADDRRLLRDADVSRLRRHAAVGVGVSGEFRRRLRRRWKCGSAPGSDGRKPRPKIGLPSHPGYPPALFFRILAAWPRMLFSRPVGVLP